MAKRFGLWFLKTSSARTETPETGRGALTRWTSRFAWVRGSSPFIRRLKNAGAEEPRDASMLPSDFFWGCRRPPPLDYDGTTIHGS
jgi:hypothetical protein